VIFAVLDVSLAVNLCINCSFLHLFLLYLPVKHTTVLRNDSGTTTSIISYELSHLAQQLARRVSSSAVVILELKQYQQ